MQINRTASAHWTGGLKDGKGLISTQSGALKDYPYGFASRFEGVAGTNPEELIGAAHAGCFTMALSLILGEAGFTAEHMETSAKVTLESVEGGFAITAIHLSLSGRIPGADEATFTELANKAKAGCPGFPRRLPRFRSRSTSRSSDFPAAGDEVPRAFASRHFSIAFDVHRSAAPNPHIQ
ncbi:osmotically inducible protein OsmC [Rhizobium leguminosarum]